ncbi:peptidoglycan D,D-transpeptidase FtsI family protein [Paludifilum halophilum]|uniref:Penicillin-binding protein n=1 Tax=Paludifilum halophilum TaxID=1642702 RepID=A0A235BB89_9BACL|nr:penicillin-binding protein 2 [Paludifilum halophilum]OYD08835.1 hypothetical protein CHM34_03340 [Paludifilum halophilum]
MREIGQRKKRRSWIVAGVLVVFFCSILLRLYWIQVVAARSFADEKADLITRAQEQQSRIFTVDSGRGMILDRNGKRMTGKRGLRLITFPMGENQLEAHEDQLRTLAKLIDYPYSKLLKKVTSLQRPVALTDAKGGEMILTNSQVQKVRSLDIPGIYAFESDNRFASDRVAQQVIGHLGRNPFLIQKKYPEEWKKGVYDAQSPIGLSGLEAAFEPFLRGGEEHFLTYATDGRGRPLNGVHVASQEEGSPRPPFQLVTTLDQGIQRRVEGAMDRAGVREGAIVVQDLQSGDLLAMASRPDSDTAEEDQNPWHNRALMATTPGSIFKTVAAAAALDTGKVSPSDTFHCNGERGSHGLTCPHRHGKQTLAEAYANSCNVVFAQVAEKVGGKTMEEYARKLGLGQKVLWSGEGPGGTEFRQLPGEQSGLIFAESTSRKDPGAMVQTGIGQRDVRMTPVQAVNMVTALFHGGKTMNPRIVKEIRRPDGKTHFRFQRHVLKNEQPIQPETLSRIRQMIRLVVTQGTAQSMKQASAPLAGKTGTAERGESPSTYNKWMVGYGPVDQPRYSVAVLIRDVSDSKDQRAKQLFQRVMEDLTQSS